MGGVMTKTHRTNKPSKMESNELPADAELIDKEELVFQLKKDSPGCTGMFWRGDPRNGGKGAPFDDWPRDNALLKGTVLVLENGEKWLQCSQVQQAGTSKWIDTKSGAWMPFRYNQYFLEEAR